jgi:hypothetical protein
MYIHQIRLPESILASAAAHHHDKSVSAPRLAQQGSGKSASLTL